MGQDIILEKYAETAVYLLKKAHPEDWTNDEAVKLARALMDLDLEKSAEYEKATQRDEEGRVMARAFSDELNKLGGIGSAVRAVGGYIRAGATAGRNRAGDVIRAMGERGKAGLGYIRSPFLRAQGQAGRVRAHVAANRVPYAVGAGVVAGAALPMVGLGALERRIDQVVSKKDIDKIYGR